ncbi:MAG: hypothetical protein R2825_28600 [Saprospiraceae bacterium]
MKKRIGKSNTLNFYIIILLIALFFGACKKNNNGKEIDVLTQIYPKSITVDPRPIEFKWESTYESVHFEILDKGGQVILDTIVQGDALTLTKFLYANSTYMWRISAEEMSAESEFFTTNAIDWFSGVYELTAIGKPWGEASVGNDTTYYRDTKIEISRSGEEILVKDLDYGATASHAYAEQWSTELELVYDKEQIGLRSTLRLFLENDSLSMVFCACGNATGTQWVYSAKKE